MGGRGESYVYPKSSQKRNGMQLTITITTVKIQLFKTKSHIDHLRWQICYRCLNLAGLIKLSTSLDVVVFFRAEVKLPDLHLFLYPASFLKKYSTCLAISQLKVIFGPSHLVITVAID